METLRDKLDADARFEANPPKPAPIEGPTQLFIALADVYDGPEGFEGMPRCTTKALAELLLDDDVGEDIQIRAERRLAATAVETLSKALLFAHNRLSAGNDVDQAHARGIDKLLSDAGLVLAP
jgi:hypothetical protein